MIIGPEQLVTKNIQQLIANPGALQVLDFADGRVQLVAVRAYHDGPIVGQGCGKCASTCQRWTPGSRHFPPGPPDNPGR